MNKKIKIILSILFLIIITSGLYYFLNPADNDLTSELFTVKDTANISKIIITQDSSKVILSRNKKKGKWIIDNNYPADNKALKKLFQTLTEAKINKPVLNSKRDSLINNIKSEGKKAEIYNFRNKLLKEIEIGKYDKQQEGTYMYNPKEKSIFIVNIPGLENDLNYRYNTNSIYWLNPEIFSYKPNNIKEISLNYRDKPLHSFKLIILKDTANLFLLSNNSPVKNFNLKKIGSYLSYFMNVKFTSESSNTGNLRKKLLNKVPYAELTVTDISQNKKNIKLYKIQNDNEESGYDMNKLYALINNQDVVTVKYVDFDLILKDINYFVN